MSAALTHFYDRLPENERIITDVLRQILIAALPDYCKEKFSFGVPYFYGNKGICIIWPASVPRGGISSGVLFGFWQGNKLDDKHHYLTHGTNKKVYYRIYQSPEEINQKRLKELLAEAVRLDRSFK